jgi:hypothetical protein
MQPDIATTEHRLAHRYAQEAIEFLYQTMNDESTALELRVECARILTSEAAIPDMNITAN